MPEEIITTEEPRTGFTCDRCGCELTESTGDVEHDDVHRCQDCHDHVYATCPDCDETVLQSETITVRNSRGIEIEVCPSCRDNDYNLCYDCHYIFHEDNTSHVGGNNVCDSCLDEDYFTCESCEERQHNDNYGSNNRCQSCCDEDESRTIQPYDSNPDLTPLGKGPHYYGVELEVECDGDLDSAAESICEKLGSFAITKHDGSLNRGFEIVTRPASFELQLKNWRKLFSDMPSGLKSFNTNTCGLHVHCSRKPLSALTIGRLLCFINDRRHHSFIERIASRPFGHWGKYKNKGLKDGSKSAEERYEALNLMNSGTIEFRIFKGTLKGASVYKAIEFCDALIHFAQPWTENNEEAAGLDAWITFEGLLGAFCAYVEKRRKQWPHLWGFMSAKWLGRETKESKAHNYTVIKEEQ